MSVADRLKAKFDSLEINGLVDVKFDVDLSNLPDAETVMREVEALYEAIELGKSTPLEFNDSTHGLMAAL